MALLTALALGIVAPKEAFTGFADDIVIIVGSALSEIGLPPLPTAFCFLTLSGITPWRPLRMDSATLSGVR